MNNIYLQYLEKLDYNDMPDFLNKYLSVPSLVRLKKIGYFCGMDYASKDVYDFPEYISRFDHSLTVALLTWKFTKDKCATLAGLFHDVSTPCFSHVIDYMNKDYENQESTEEYTESILSNDKYLMKCLDSDNINLLDIISFKKYNIVDNNRPKLCTDRLDGVILTGLFWTKNLNISDVKKIIEDIEVYRADNLDEIGFKSRSVAELVLKVNKEIDIFCHSKEDNFMMELLASITKNAIDKNIISYEDLYVLTEEEIFYLFDNSNDDKILRGLEKFRNIKIGDIPELVLPDVKVRNLSPLVDGHRLK